VNDMGDRPWANPETWDEWTAKMKAAHGNGNGHGKSLAIEAQRLLPTPRSQHGEDRNNHIWERPADQPQNLENALAHVAPEGQDWGVYADAIARWERILGRPAPSPTTPSRKGTPQLNPAFSEWMMGLPAGHVTDVPSLSRNDMLKAFGNGVVPAQAEAAVRFLLTAALRVVA
jgi:DNA (cytosine-5)-methyltransferase 1